MPRLSTRDLLPGAHDGIVVESNDEHETDGTTEKGIEEQESGVHMALEVRALMICAAMVAAVPTGEQVGSAQELPPRLVVRSLVYGCDLEVRWIGVVPRRPEGVFLVCRSEHFLVLRPSNLYDHVRIRDSNEALEFVRFFTSPENYRLFDMDGFVEVTRAPGKPVVELGFNEVDPLVFDRHFNQPVVKMNDDGALARFEIERHLVQPGNKVYLVRETVLENGYYSMQLIRLVIEDGSSIGLMHFGDL